MQSVMEDRQGWNAYWSRANNGGIAYALVAEFYRKCIIRPTLNHFITKHIPLGAKLLHAGCGSGQVDTDLAEKYSITGLDISPKALELYSSTLGKKVSTVHASAFETGLENRTFDGIYNLGVMEHFTEAEIQDMLLEFKRVLKEDGKLVIFWPPEFGLSVLFFKFLRGVIKLLTKKDVQFHPDEITRLQSKDHAFTIFNQAGFEIVEYSFGLRDVFTYSIIVGKKKK